MGVMAVSKETIELIEQLANGIERWAENKPEKNFPDFKFLSDIIYYASNVDKKAAVQQLSRIDRILLSLRKHNQGWADALEEKVQDLRDALSSVDRLVGYGHSRRQCVHTLETPALRLVQTLRDVAKMAREELVAKKPAETEQDIPPTIFRRIWTGVKGFIKEAYRITIKSFFDSVMNK